MYAWLTTQIGADAASVISYVAMAVTLFAIAWLCLAFFRRLNDGSFRIIGKKRNHRLSVRDAAAVDSRRRLVLVRRDNVEHLLLVGGPSDVVVECNINAAEHKRHAEAAHAGLASLKAPPKAKAASKAEEKSAEAAHVQRMSEKPEEEEAQAAKPEAASQEMPRQRDELAARPHANGEQGVPQQNGFSPQNAIPHAVAASRRPPAPQAHAHPQTSPYLAGNKPAAQPAMHKAAPSQAPQQNHAMAQQHPAMPITTNSAAAGNRPQQQSPRQGAPISVQAAPPVQNMRQTPPAPRQPPAQRPNGTPGYASPYQNYAAQQPQPPTNNGTPAMPRNNGGISDLPNINPRTVASGKPVTAAQSESAVDLSRNKQEPGFSKTSVPGEGDFDKILQEELMRSQTNIKVASSHKK